MTRNIPELLLKCVQIILGIVAAVIVIAAISNINTESADSGTERLETSIRRSVMACYASEGVFPPDIQYLKDRYGLQVDETKYAVIYSVFAENLMPEITVTEKKS